MRICGICKNAYRTNDPGGQCTVPEDNPHQVAAGHYSACSECCALYDPLGPFTLTVAALNRRHDWSTNTPEHVPSSYFHPLSNDAVRGLGSAPPWFCAVCRRCARENDTMKAMRLHPEDSPDEPYLFPNAICARFHDGYCTVCAWRGVFEDYCPACPRDPGGPRQTRRACGWHGPYQQTCPDCGGPTIRREECYYSCGECREKYAPAILARLKRTFPSNRGLQAMTPEQIVNSAQMLA